MNEQTEKLRQIFVPSVLLYETSPYPTMKESKGPKAVIPIKDLNATFQPEKISHPHGLQVTYQESDHTRSLYVYHESPQVRARCHPRRCLLARRRISVFLSIPKEIVTWYNAIRAARYAYLRTAYPTGTDEEVGITAPATRDYLETICGYSYFSNSD